MAAFLAGGGFGSGDRALFAPGGSYGRLVSETAVLMLGGVSVSSGEAKAVFAADCESADALAATAGAGKAVFFSGGCAPDGKTAAFEAALKFGFMNRKRMSDDLREVFTAVSPEQTAFEIRGGEISQGAFTEMLAISAERAGDALGPEAQSFCHLPEDDLFSRAARFLPLFASARWAEAVSREEFFTDVLEVMPTAALVDTKTVEAIARGESGFQGFGGRLRCILTARSPAVNGFYSDMGIEVRVCMPEDKDW